MEFYRDILELITSYGYVLLFLAAAIEGPTVTIIAGFLVTQGVLPFFPAYLLVVTGDVFGDIFYYALGRWGKRWIGRWSVLQNAQQSPAADYLRENPMKALSFAKMMYTAGQTFLVTAGLIRVNFGTFVAANFLATIIKAFVLLSLGIVIGSFYNTVHAQLGKITLIFFVGLGIGAIRYVQAQLRSPNLDTGS